MKSALRPIFITVSALLVALAISAWVWQVAHANEKQPDAKGLPEFAIPDLLTPDIEYTAASVRGAVTLLSVWSLSCATCVEDIPFLDELRSQYGIRVVGLYHDVHLDPVFGKGSLAKTQQQVIERQARFGNPYEFTMLDTTRDVAAALGVTLAPEYYLLDAQGTIRWHHTGGLNENVWNKHVVEIIASLPATDNHSRQLITQR